MKRKLILISLVSVITISILAACNAIKDNVNLENQNVLEASEDLNHDDTNQENTEGNQIQKEDNTSEEMSKAEVGSINELSDINNIDIIIKDDTFITQMDEVFINIYNYVGKTMKVEGIVKNVSGNKFTLVRLYDMQHEDHSHEVTVGIDAEYDGEVLVEDSWVEISGVIDKQFKDEKDRPVLKVKSLEKKFTWGQAKVVN